MSKKRLTRDEKKQQTRNELINIAAELFSKNGFHATSVEQIAEEAGYSKGAVYSNFGSKDDLFLSVFSHNQKDDLKKIKTIADEYNTLESFIKNMEKNLQYEIKDNRDWSILKLEFLLFAMRNEAAREKLSTILKESRTEMMEILNKFYNTNEQSILPIEEVTYLLSSLDIGIGIQSYVDEENIPDYLFSEGLKLLLDPK